MLNPARVDGQPVKSFPADLYIPPDALEVILESFEGPLDLLLYLIRKQNLDIQLVDLSALTAQYMAYIEAMQGLRFELAADYLVMAALLAEIKSASLLPARTTEPAEEEDPRAELIRRLQVYEQFRLAAIELDKLPRDGRDHFPVGPERPQRPAPVPPNVSLADLLAAMQRIERRSALAAHHAVRAERLSTRARMSSILLQLAEAGSGSSLPFSRLYRAEEGRAGVVVSFVALLELVREHLVEIVQTQAFSAIMVRSKMDTDENTDGCSPDH